MKRFPEEQIIGYLKQAEAGLPPKEYRKRFGVRVASQIRSLEPDETQAASDTVQLFIPRPATSPWWLSF